MFYEHNQSKPVMCTDLCLIQKTRADMKCHAVQSGCHSRMLETDAMGPECHVAPGKTRGHSQRQGSLGIKGGLPSPPTAPLPLLLCDQLP